MRPPLQPKRRNIQDDAEQENIAPNTFDFEKRDCSVARSVALDSTKSLFKKLSTMAHEGRRVQGWSTELFCSAVVLYKLEVKNAVPRVRKAVTFSSDFCLSVSANGQLVPSTVYTESSHLEVKSFSELTCRLSHVEKLKSCQGFPAKLYPQISSSSEASKDDMQLLPLPTKAHLRQIISGIPCKYGYNEVALSTIKEHYQGKSHIRRCGVLLVHERHFGLARSFGGDESHTTVVNISQIFRLLSLYTLIKTALRGSAQGTPCSVLISVTDTLKRTKDAHQEEKVRLHDVVKAKMMEITTASADASEQGASGHAYYRGDVEDTVVYYLCGYVIHKFTKHAACHLSIEDISSATPVLASHSYLTEYRSFKQGSLKHPTQKMLTIIEMSNKIILACLDKEGLYGDIFWKVLEELEEHYLSRLGCDQHSAAFTCRVSNFFVITRMHFYSWDVNRHLGSIEKGAIANKKAYLL
ncbi:hypothetical protein HPB51_024391 [Rhipicephalus microplus]|uniref:Uncharacterized protein n=1 Tax=Rhipicephalus microplus TaxID=6941 RepID=A0A9J6D7I3_RHIMP|nr:hypothetical protein HPB51_024391 [Rhipicephalus microplus]